MKAALYLRLVALVNALEGVVIRQPALYRLLLTERLSGLRARLGAWRAWAAVQRAYREVPAYRQFLDARGGRPVLRYRDGVPDLSVVPETDKGSYVLAYGHEARCVGGRLPDRGVVVDESSGSSGRPVSWVRGERERWVTKRTMQLSFRIALGDQPCFAINAFALGAWATGLSVTQSLNDVCVMKSTGPDIDKIVHTLGEFGPDYDYVVMGYPPFLKTLADDPRVDWSAYRVRAVFGGEAISESMRRYLLRSFAQVLGSYGASDLEINIAAESAFTLRLREELARNETLRERLTRTGHGVLPMIFQYNPLAHHLETNSAGELVVTLARPSALSPRIRYNIHDWGHAAGFEDVASVLSDVGLAHLVEQEAPLRLPLLFLYGRSDLSIDYFGANVTPDSVREILNSIDELAPHLGSFRLISGEGERHDTTMEVAIELAGCDPEDLDAGAIGDQLYTHLAQVNGDFRNAYRRTAAAEQLPRLSLHRSGTGPFAGPERIKHQYVAAGATS